MHWSIWPLGWSKKREQINPSQKFSHIFLLENGALLGIRLVRWRICATGLLLLNRNRGYLSVPRQSDFLPKYRLCFLNLAPHSACYDVLSLVHLRILTMEEDISYSSSSITCWHLIFGTIGQSWYSVKFKNNCGSDALVRIWDIIYRKLLYLVHIDYFDVGLVVILPC